MCLTGFKEAIENDKFFEAFIDHISNNYYAYDIRKFC